MEKAISAVFDPWSIPFLNTLILLVSGSFVTWSHHSLLAGRYYQSISGLFFTICLAGVFLFVQFAEYKQAEFCLSDGIYGSTFFMTTGCHGLHVLIGTIFLFVCFLRLIRYQLTLEHHFGYESAIWYWHFVGEVVLQVKLPPPQSSPLMCCEVLGRFYLICFSNRSQIRESCSGWAML